MNDLNKISRGEVFYITSRFDTVGSEQRSGRPAVIVSNNINNEFSPVVEICYLTLQEKTELPTHVFVDRGACVNSLILCEQITSVSKDRLGDYMCKLPDDIMDAVDKALIESLGLNYIVERESGKSSAISVLSKGSSSNTSDKVVEEYKQKIEALEAENKELTKARDSLLKKSDSADNSKQEAKLYKKMYEDLLDRVLGK